DFCTGEILMLKDGVQTLLFDTQLEISSFGEDEAGEIYVVSLTGQIYRLSNPDAVNLTQRPYTTVDTIPYVGTTTGAAPALTTGYARIQADAGQVAPSGLAI